MVFLALVFLELMFLTLVFLTLVLLSLSSTSDTLQGIEKSSFSSSLYMVPSWYSEEEVDGNFLLDEGPAAGDDAAA